MLDLTVEFTLYSNTNYMYSYTLYLEFHPCVFVNTSLVF